MNKKKSAVEQTTFEQLNLSIINLLLEKRSNKTYKESLNEIFKAYKDGLLAIEETVFSDKLPENISKTKIIEIVKKKMQRLKTIYTKYSKGKFAEANKLMGNLIFNDEGRYKTLNSYNKANIDTNWYRARLLTTDDRDFSPRNMFHVPFESRHLIVNYRYSISGYPCLYIGKTPLTCWEEMHKPSLHDLCVCQLRLKENIKILDLTLPDTNDETALFSDISPISLYNLLLTWPIIIACSVRVRYPNAPFKPEYVIPQLIMQTIQKKSKEIYGIAYTSTRRDMHYSKNMDKHMNIAIPVRNVSDKGYCSDLKSKFQSTRGVPYMEMELKDTLARNYGCNSDYERTKFYHLEEFLETQNHYDLTYRDKKKPLV